MEHVAPRVTVVRRQYTSSKVNNMVNNAVTYHQEQSAKGRKEKKEGHAYEDEISQG